MTSASGELASDEESASDDVSFFWAFCLQNFLSSELLLFITSSFLLVDSVALICSSIPVL